VGGPTAFDWSVLVEGVQALGLETELASAHHDSRARDADLPEQLFERVREEIDRGRPCVVWGATGAAEFGIVYGYSGRGYLVRSCRSARPDRDGPLEPREHAEEPVRYDSLSTPGCVAGFFFGEPVEIDKARAGRSALARAVKLLRGEHVCFEPGYSHGAAAFEAWAAALEQGRAEPVGNAYNAASCRELQIFAASFVNRLARTAQRAGSDLDSAAMELRDTVRNLDRLAVSFPLPTGGDIDDMATRQRAGALLRACAPASRRAADSIARALALI
jgi:hypothetical protein